MRKMFLVLLVLFVLAFGLGYIAAREGSFINNNNKSSEGTTPNEQNKAGAVSSEVIGKHEDPIQAQIKKMSLEEKVGQLVMVGIDEYENDHNSRQLIEKYHVGGFVLLKKNVKDAEQMLTLLNSLKETNGVNKTPLFLAIDEEGGRISRMPQEFLKIPSSKKIGEVNDEHLSYQVGSLLGEELKVFGLNMNFAPVLDVNSNPKNPVIGDRAFGSNSGIVSKLGIQTMKGIQSQGIVPVVKHFPGHGDTSVDSHIGLPRVNHDLKRLETFELQPFAAAINEKAEAVMIAHILLPKIDPHNPASFSKTIITDLLRDKLNFDGVVITDDLTMGAIVNNYDIGEAAVKSINAGADLVLVCHDNAKEVAVIQAIQKAAESGRISLERLEQSVYRILKLKQQYVPSDELVDSVDPQSINNKIEELLKKLT